MITTNDISDLPDLVREIEALVGDFNLNIKQELYLKDEDLQLRTDNFLIRLDIHSKPKVLSWYHCGYDHHDRYCAIDDHILGLLLLKYNWKKIS